jgi:hypothetical protein
MISSLILYFFILLFILPSVFEYESEDMGLIILNILLGLILLVIVILWFFGIKIPLFTGKVLEFDNNTIIAFFTIVLGIGTLINLYVYKKSINLARLSALDIELNEELNLKVINLGDFAIKRLWVEMELKDETERLKRKGNFSYKKIFKNIKQEFKDYYQTKTIKISYLSPHNYDFLDDFKDFIVKRFKLNEERDNTRNELWGFFIKGKKDFKYRIRVIVKYSSDTFQRAPCPLVRDFWITSNNGNYQVKYRE